MARYKVGDALPERTFLITQEKINRYSRYAIGRDSANIHTDAEKARLAGLPGPVAHGRHPIAFFSEAMLRAFGLPWLVSGHLEVTLTRLIMPGDTLRQRSEESAVTPVDGGSRVEIRMVLVNPKGEVVQSADGSVLVPSGNGSER